MHRVPAPLFEPTPLGGALAFEEGDFHALSASLAGDAQYNDRRLVARRKLLTLGKRAAARVEDLGLELDVRTSLHSLHAFNHMRVKRLWTYLFRRKAEKRRLASVLGPDLGKDLDSAYRNAYLCIALEEDAVEVSLKIHAEAWYDGQNLVNRAKREGLAAWLAHLNELPGFRLRLADWKGEWPCGRLQIEELEEFSRYYKPGEHALSVERRFPAPPGSRGGVLSPEAPDGLVQELSRLVPLYRHAAWSRDNDHLFAGAGD